MARIRRNSELGLSFDGLTDSTTNLVGTLILLVFLLVGVTASKSPEVPGVVPQSWPELREQSESLSGPRSVDELLRLTEVLQAEISAAEAEISDLEEKQLPALYKRAQQLLDNEAGRNADPLQVEGLVWREGCPPAELLDRGILHPR